MKFGNRVSNFFVFSMPLSAALRRRRRFVAPSSVQMYTLDMSSCFASTASASASAPTVIVLRALNSTSLEESFRK